MTDLPHYVAEQFLAGPESNWSAESRRLSAFLRHIAKRIDEETRLRIYGSAAVAFYTARLTGYAHITDDIDVGDPGSISSALEKALPDPDPHLTFHFRRPGMWLAAPGWTQFCVEITASLDTTPLHVELMHPVDLVISKLIRWNERDAEDVNRLRTIFPLQAKSLASRLNEAVEHSVISPWESSQLNELLEELFSDPDELELARTLTPSLKALDE